MTNCILCAYTIKEMDDPKKTKRDTLAFTFYGHTICGYCAVELRERLNQ